MAIDSRDERASCLGIGLIALRAWPNPSGDLSGRGKRQHMAGLFVGAAAVVSGGVSPFQRLRIVPPPWVEVEIIPLLEQTLWGWPVATRDAEEFSFSPLVELRSFGTPRASLAAMARISGTMGRMPRLRAAVSAVTSPVVAGADEIGLARAVRQPSRPTLLAAVMKLSREIRL